MTEAREYFDVKTLLSWSGPARPFRKKERSYYISVFVFFMLLEVIVFLFQDPILMLIVFAVAFLAVVLASIPPQTYHFKVTTEGVQVEDHFYIWEELYDFYFRRMENMDTLIIRTEAMVPGEIRLPLKNVSKEHARHVLVQFLPYREVVRLSTLEKASDWLSKNIPLDRG